VRTFVFKKAFALAALLFVLQGAAFAAGPFAKMGILRPRVRMEAPAFSLPDIHGGRQSLADFRGKIVLLNFWATWCPDCREEMPSLEKLWEKYKTKGTVVIAVAVDRNRSEVVSFSQKLGLTFPILPDPEGGVRKEYEVTALPMTYFIGKDGKISGRLFGGRDWAGKDADALMRHLLGSAEK
jgi:peroxiredoxin